MQMTTTDHRPAHYRSDIDGLRAIAVLLVLVFHFRLISGGDVGFIGVDIFFVISGYLITGILYADLESGRFSFSEFYIRRIRRLAPALFATLLLTVVLGAWLLFPANFEELARQVLSAQFYVSNFYYWKNVSYFGLSAQAAPLLHSWSLAEEEQFYLLYPVLVFVLHRFYRRHFWLALAGVGALSLLLSGVLSSIKPGFAFYLLPTRAWELILGGLAVPLTLHMGAWQARHGMAVAAASCALLVLALFTYTPGIPVPGLFALLPTLAAAGLIVSGAGNASTRPLLGSRPMIAIGRISYPLYLVHWPLHVFATVLLGHAYTWNWRFAFFLLSIALAALVWRWVEEPVRSKRVLPLNKQLLGAYGMGLTLTASFYVAADWSHGFPDRFSPPVQRMASFAEDKVPPLGECQFEVGKRFDQGFGCIVGDTHKAPTWLIVGDSHAWAAHDALDRWLQSRGVSAQFAFRHSCPPLQGITLVQTDDKGGCKAFNDEIRNYLGHTDAIRQVMLISTWRQFPEGVVSDSSNGQVLDTTKDSAGFQKVFHQNLAWLHEHGKTVHLWEPVPGARLSVPESLAKDLARGTSTELRHSLSDYQSEFKFLFDAMRNDADWIDFRYSPSRRLCSSGLCDVVSEGTPLYFDNSHVSRSSWPIWLDVLQAPIAARQ